jgi:hypothetical protein
MLFGSDPRNYLITLIIHPQTPPFLSLKHPFCYPNEPRKESDLLKYSNALCLKYYLNTNYQIILDHHF